MVDSASACGFRFTVMNGKCKNSIANVANIILLSVCQNIKLYKTLDLFKMGTTLVTTILFKTLPAVQCTWRGECILQWSSN